jgi:hypothetical protein
MRFDHLLVPLGFVRGRSKDPDGKADQGTSI